MLRSLRLTQYKDTWSALQRAIIYFEVYYRSKQSGLLGIEEALKLVTDDGCDLHIKTELFLCGMVGWEKLLSLFELEAKSAESGIAVGVLISIPYPILLAATACGSVIVFDSHAHTHQFGALVSVSN